MERPDEEALKRALFFIRHKPRTAGEVRQRLYVWGYDSRTADEVLDYLECSGYIEDREFAGAYVDEMLRKGYGQRLIRERLFQKKLSRGVIEEAMLKYPCEDDERRAYELGIKRAKRMVSQDKRLIYGKLRRFLEGRGYGNEVAGRVAATIANIDTGYGQE